ncbi:MAG: glycosyltransferase family 2 protein [Flavobacteriaceae bacterium]
MISILIPTYNYDVLQLVSTINKQAKEINGKYEIIICDDCSSTNYDYVYNQFNKEVCIKVIKSKKNNGLAITRNILAQSAEYDWLLFLDADVIPKEENFLKKYYSEISLNTSIVYGGLEYLNTQSNFSLRYKIGVKREAIEAKTRSSNNNSAIHFSNIVISKKVFNTIKFDESITNYGHEDTLFHYQIQKQNYPIKHINNAVYHLGIYANVIFIRKMRESVTTLYTLDKQEKIPKNYTKLQRTYLTLKKYKAQNCFLKISNVFLTLIIKNLESKKPSLFLFDIFKLNYFCHLKLEGNA